MATQREISAIAMLTILRSGLLIFISLQLSLGCMVQYIGSFQADSIELAQEKDIETEEKEGKEETEKDELMSKIFSCDFLNQEKFHSIQTTYWNWNRAHGDIPTPPPRS